MKKLMKMEQENSFIENKGKYSVYTKCRLNFLGFFVKYSMEKIGVIKKNRFNEFQFKQLISVRLDSDSLLEIALFMKNLK